MLYAAYEFTKSVCAEDMMRTTLNIDDDMLRTVQEETGARTKTQAVHEALRDFVRRRKIEKLIQLQGKVRFSSDAKTLRKDWERNQRGNR
jgi:Arc/MetJ family transcription regulator